MSAAFTHEQALALLPFIDFCENVLIDDWADAEQRKLLDYLEQKSLVATIEGRAVLTEQGQQARSKFPASLR